MFIHINIRIQAYAKGHHDFENWNLSNEILVRANFDQSFERAYNKVFFSGTSKHHKCSMRPPPEADFCCGKIMKTRFKNTHQITKTNLFKRKTLKLPLHRGRWLKASRCFVLNLRNFMVATFFCEHLYY